MREWIEAGAVWSGNEIDPLVQPGGGRAGLNWIRRLITPEYVQTVLHATGVDISKEAAVTGQRLPPDNQADGFTNTAYNLSIDLGHVEAYAHLARVITSRMDAAQLPLNSRRQLHWTRPP